MAAWTDVADKSNVPTLRATGSECELAIGPDYRRHRRERGVHLGPFILRNILSPNKPTVSPNLSLSVN
jgi:hypothetical protein